jgi:hypothetical protein
MAKLIEKLLRMSDSQVMDFVHGKLSKLGYTIKRDSDKYLWSKGDFPVCIVAHADVVEGRKRRLKRAKNDIIFHPGADDRAGIYAILELAERGAKKGRKPCIIVTNYEEIGGLGAQDLASDEDFEKYDVNFFIELDRRGSNDAVYYSCDNEEFKDFISSFGFEERPGTFSDISILMPYKACGVNLSIGYYREHTKNEYLKLRVLKTNIERVDDILDVAFKENKKFEFIPEYEYYREEFLYPEWEYLIEEVRGMSPEEYERFARELEKEGISIEEFESYISEREEKEMEEEKRKWEEMREWKRFWGEW